MFFILSKILLFLIKPFVVLSLLLILSFFIKNQRWKKRVRIGVLAGFILFTNGFIVKEVTRWWEVPAVEINQLTDDYQYGIVLGGVTDPEREPTDRLYFKKGADRVIHAIYLYKAGKIDKIIFTGGKAKLFEESGRDNNAIADFYIMCGVAPEDIILENESRNTRENALFTSGIVDKNRKHILITSAFHMRRASACFEKAGLDITPFSADFDSEKEEDRYDFSLFIPSAESLSQWDKLIKEWVGIIAYKVAGYI